MTDKPKHTPGPWHLGCMTREEHPCNCGTILTDGYAGGIATVYIDNGLLVSEGGNACPPLEEAQANARLIAAAPDMYEALVKISEGWASYASASIARAALAKVRGV